MKGASSAAAGTFLEVAALVPAPWQELAAEALSLPGSTGVAFGAPSLARPAPEEGMELVRAFFPAALDGPELRAALARRLARLAADAGADELAALAPTFRLLPPEDWASSWRKHWRPLRIGRLCLLPPGTARALKSGELALWIEPGAAFGTGRHATTRLALRALLARLRPGQRVLDAGTGSGLLAVAAARLGAAEALGFDCDATAVAAARELARENGVADRARFFQADLGALPELVPAEAAGGRARLERFDGLLANLYADLVRGRAGELAARLAPGGWFAITGCRTKDRRAVGAALAAAGLLVERIHARGRWDCFAGRRPRRRGPGRAERGIV